MSDQSANNKRIAKNTLLLYFRMFITMTVTLYTSRVIINALGIEDYGIFNVVSGVVSMMGILNGAMSVSTQRYLTFELGKNNTERLKQVFSMCFNIYMILVIIIIILAETIGLWFLNNELIIPENRINAANWIYQFAILSCICSLITNPFNACIISHEKMNIYAYVSILDVVLKLSAAYIILIIESDKLIIYGFIIFLIHLIMTSIYYVYCVNKFTECRYSFYWEKPLFKELVSYSGWNLFGSAAGLVKGQGLNILLNMFFNPAVNASRGIAFQISNAINLFFTNFYTAVRPQITKYYAQGDLDNMFKLVFHSSKQSYYLILIISLPIIIEAPFIIDLWLGQTPEYVVIFTQLIIAITAIDAMANPLMTTAHATGNIKLYQSVVGTMIILNIPISYLFLKQGFSPVIVFDISIVISIICLFTRLWIVKRLVNFPVKDYIKNVLLVAIVVTLISIIIPIALHCYLKHSFISTIIVCVSSIVSTLLSIYLIGLKDNEIKFFKTLVMKKIHKI